MTTNIIKELQDIVTEICDHYCRFPNDIADQEVLNDICEHCPMNRIWGGYEE